MRRVVTSRSSPRSIQAERPCALAVALLFALAVGPPPSVSARDFEVTAADRAWWAFQPIERPAAPLLPGGLAAAHPVDGFVRAALADKELTPSPAAPRRELVRRAFFDLVGLPPTPEEVDAFVADDSPAAWERLIDALLARPQFGERWGRHWLDVVRFAQTNGYERDDEKPLAWRYRDYVIRAFNEDTPYDRFIREQLAGDELDEPTPDAIIATAFYRLGVWDDEPDDKLAAEYEALDDIARTIGAAFLGLTVGCARCHDHMFDPISQEDYYSFLSFFHNVREYDRPRFALDSATYAPLAPKAEVERWRAEQRSRIDAIETRRAAAADETAKKRLDEELERARDAKPPFEWALAVRERGPKARPTHVLARGNAHDAGKEVLPSVPSVLDGRATLASADTFATPISSGRRRALAEWIASPRNPLAARVLVNRLWQHLFGRGIVRTPNDFGRAGFRPTHPELLDWLAAEFLAGDMRIKPLLKTIMLSETYRMSSRNWDARAQEVDPGNDLFWRQNLRRLEAESIRDAVLATSGTLNPAMGGRGFFPELAGEVVAGASRPGLGWDRSDEDERRRRSVYIFVKRTMRVPLMECFDYVNTDGPLGVRPQTTVAPQALMLLNSDFMQRAAASFAERLVRDAAGGDTAALVERAYRLTLGRAPTASEQQVALGYLERQRRAVLDATSRFDFSPTAPPALEGGYMSRLPARGFIDGPASGWRLERGVWNDRGEGIWWMDPERGPYALLEGERFSDAVVTARVLLRPNTEFASVLFRARADGAAGKGYALTLRPEDERVALERHTDAVVELAAASFPLRAGATHELRIDARGSRLRVWIDGADAPLPAPLIDFDDPSPVTEAGHLGVRVLGAPLSLDAIAIDSRIDAEIDAVTNTGDGVTRVEPPRLDEADAERRALESLCLVLFNLSEFVCVD